MSGEKKRPAAEASQGAPAGQLGELAQQIDYFERLAEQEGDHQEAKKPAKASQGSRVLLPAPHSLLPQLRNAALLLGFAGAQPLLLLLPPHSPQQHLPTSCSPRARRCTA